MAVSVRDFKAKLSHYLARVQKGETVEISSRRRIIARVTGVADERAHGLDRLTRSSSATWSGGKPAGSRVRLTEAGPLVSEIAKEDRG